MERTQTLRRRGSRARHRLHRAHSQIRRLPCLPAGKVLQRRERLGTVAGVDLPSIVAAESVAAGFRRNPDFPCRHLAFDHDLAGVAELDLEHTRALEFAGGGRLPRRSSSGSVCSARRMNPLSTAGLVPSAPVLKFSNACARLRHPALPVAPSLRLQRSACHAASTGQRAAEIR